MLILTNVFFLNFLILCFCVTNVVFCVSRVMLTKTMHLETFLLDIWLMKKKEEENSRFLVPKFPETNVCLSMVMCTFCLWILINYSINQSSICFFFNVSYLNKRNTKKLIRQRINNLSFSIYYFSIQYNRFQYFSILSALRTFEFGMQRLMRSRASSAACSTSASTCSSAVLSVRLHAFPSGSYRSLREENTKKSKTYSIVLKRSYC